MLEESSDTPLMIDGDLIAQLDLPAPIKEFMANAPLASAYPLQVSLEAECGTFPTLNVYCEEHGLPQLEGSERLYRIGTDESSQLCLTMGQGEVVAIDPTGNRPTRLVNSSFPLFISFFELYNSYTAGVASLGEEGAAMLAPLIKSAMQQLDEAAFADPDNWWPTVTEQMESDER